MNFELSILLVENKQALPPSNMVKVTIDPKKKNLHVAKKKRELKVVTPETDTQVKTKKVKRHRESRGKTIQGKDLKQLKYLKKNTKDEKEMLKASKKVISVVALPLSSPRV